MIVGVLAFQGDFAEHENMLWTLNLKTVQVRSMEDLEQVNRLIIPGGESTVMAKFLKETGVGDEAKKRVKNGTLAVYGTCAGAILLSRNLSGKNDPETLQLMNISVDRNAYGTQYESFEEIIEVAGIAKPMQVSFIRAPRITNVGEEVEVLAMLGNDPILVRQGRMLAGTFHPEVRGNTEIHELFLRM